MEYTISISVSDQCLSLSGIQSVNGTVDIVRCAFTFDATWDDFPARQAIFKNAVNGSAYVAAIAGDTCIVPWEVLKSPGAVRMALVGTNTDGQTQRTETVTLVKQTATLQGGVNSIDPTPDQYAQFIAQVAEMIGEAGVLSVNGKTGNVTLTAEDVGALSDEVTVPTKTSDLVNDSGFLTSAPVTSVNSKTGAVTLTASDVGALPSDTQIPTRTSQLTNDSGFLTGVPSEYVTESELATAISGKANRSELAAVATSGQYSDLTGKPTIPTKTSELTNDSGFLSSVPSEYVTETELAAGLAPKANTADLATVATSGSYADLSNKPGNATTTTAGLMSATDKANLDAVFADYSSAITALGA